MAYRPVQRNRVAEHLGALGRVIAVPGCPSPVATRRELGGPPAADEPDASCRPPAGSCARPPSSRPPPSEWKMPAPQVGGAGRGIAAPCSMLRAGRQVPKPSARSSTGRAVATSSARWRPGGGHMRASAATVRSRLRWTGRYAIRRDLRSGLRAVLPGPGVVGRRDDRLHGVAAAQRRYVGRVRPPTGWRWPAAARGGDRAHPGDPALRRGVLRARPVAGASGRHARVADADGDHVRRDHAVARSGARAGRPDRGARVADAAAHVVGRHLSRADHAGFFRRSTRCCR